MTNYPPLELPRAHKRLPAAYLDKLSAGRVIRHVWRVAPAFVARARRRRRVETVVQCEKIPLVSARPPRLAVAPRRAQPRIERAPGFRTPDERGLRLAGVALAGVRRLTVRPVRRARTVRLPRTVRRPLTLRPPLTVRRLLTVRRARTFLPALVVLVLLAAPAGAAAHLRSGTVAVDYRASISTSDPAAYSARIFQSDRALGITVKSGHVVILIGYLGEPVFRLDDAGLWLNAASPTAVVLRLIKKSERVVSSAARWRLERRRHSVVWPDARAQGLPAHVPGGRWSVPLLVDGRSARLGGELRRYPAPAPGLWLGLLAGLLLAGSIPLRRRWRNLAGRGAIVCAVPAAAAGIVVLIAFVLDAYASPGTWIEAVDALVFLAAGVWVLLRGPEHWRVAGAVGLGLVALAVALLETPIFLHPLVLAVLPGSAVRLAAVLAIGAGLDATVLGAVSYLDAAVTAANERPPAPAGYAQAN